MANLQSVLPGGFNANEVEPQAPMSNEPLPAGVYDVEVTNTEVKETKSGNGTMLKVEYTVLGPTHARRKVWQNINIRHTNSQAEQIGQSQLSALCRAVGIAHLTDSDQLFQRVLRVSVKIRPAEGQYAASNDVTGYEPAGSAPPPAAAAPAPQQRAAAPATPPWQKRAA
jgi:hypothetical protein